MCLENLKAEASIGRGRLSIFVLANMALVSLQEDAKVRTPALEFSLFRTCFRACCQALRWPTWRWPACRKMPSEARALRSRNRTRIIDRRVAAASVAGSRLQT